MLRSRTRTAILTILSVVLTWAAAPPRASAQVTREQVESAIREGVNYLITRQNDNGSWTDVDHEPRPAPPAW